MKFTRRPDLDPDTRIEIVKLAWLHQGVYGKMTQIAQSYHISRTFLYQLLVAAHLQLHILFSEEQRRVPNAQPHVEQLVLLLRLEGRCSIPSISSILKHLGHQPNSLGYLSAWLQRSGRLLPSTLSMASKKWGFYLSDEIFAIQAPILVTIDAPSTTILNIELASDRGVGLVAGYHAAFEAALWVCDYFHAFQDLFNLLHQLERKAYGAIGKEDEAARKWENAKSEANFAKRLEQYEQAQQACEQALALYDHLDLLLHLLRESLQLCSPTGKLRTVEGVRSEFTLLLEMIEAVDSQAIASIIKPIRAHIDDLLVLFSKSKRFMPNFLKSFRIRFWISSFWLGIMTISITPLNPSKNVTINESETIGWRLLKASWMMNLQCSKRWCLRNSIRLSEPLHWWRW